jgi:hypothetical protein
VTEARGLYSTPGPCIQSFAWGEFLFRDQATENVFGCAAISTNPQLLDTNVFPNHLETSRPRGRQRIVFIAFGNLRGFTR